MIYAHKGNEKRYFEMSDKHNLITRPPIWISIVIAVISIVSGIFTIINPGTEMATLAFYAGIILIIYGALRIIIGCFLKNEKKDKVIDVICGLIAVVLGILDLCNVSLIGKYIPVLFGFLMIVCAVSALIRCLSVSKYNKQSKKWIASAILAVIVFVIGLLIILNPSIVGKTFGILFGVAMLLNGLSSLITAFACRTKLQ